LQSLKDFASALAKLGIVMDLTSFVSSEAGKIVRMPTGYTAFIPSPIPRDVHYDAELVLALSRADTALSELSGLGRQLPNPYLLIAPYMRREAVLSSRIEGTRVSISDLLLEEAEAKTGAPEGEMLEVRNYVAALEYGIERLVELPLSLRLVREIHKRLMQGVRGEHGTPGAFRRSQNWIGPPGSDLMTAAYVPPPQDAMMQGLDDWEKFLHERDVMPDLIQCAVMHEQFEAIHPFIDGNGRVGRLLIILFLLERQRLSAPLLYLSAYIEARRDAYYDLLQRVRTHGDWRSWIRFFLEGVTHSAGAAVQQSRELMDLREAFRSHLSQQGKALALVDQLFMNPYVTVAGAANLLGTSKETARHAVSVLEQSDILEEVTGKRWGRLYLARPILDAIQNPTGPRAAKK
jgi:Fic family protein